MLIKKNIKILIILDGIGISKNRKYNALYQANSIILKWLKIYPSCLLKAYGQYVGLFNSLIGNSEVGHLTIGSGRIIKQPVTLIHEAIKNGQFFKNKLLINSLKKLKNKNTRLHIMGLLSDAGIHSHIEILFALLKLAKNIGIKEVIIHGFLDGRDVWPKSAKKYLLMVEKQIKNLKIGKIGSLHGRFYAMDRDNNWQRTKKSYDILTKKSKVNFDDWRKLLKYFYKKSITDEFIKPSALINDAFLKDQDGLIFFNIREDRARQITQAILSDNFDKFKTQNINLLWFITGILYSPDFKTKYICKKKLVTNTLFDILEKNNLKIFSIAESEKYAHITYFFNGGREIIRPNETRVLIKSKSYSHNYAKIPHMSAEKITDSIINSLEKDPKDFYLVNYANADMVGHSGQLNPTIEAIEFLDKQIERIRKILIEKYDGTIYLTSDHGKAEEMYNYKIKKSITSHTKNPVPFIFINKDNKYKHYKLNLTQLQDIAQFILKDLNLKVPKIMRHKNKI